MKTKVLSFFVALLSFSFFVPNAYARRICYYFYFDNTNMHQYEDENVRVYMVTSGIYISNKTDKIIYVDKERSFSILNGSYEKMFKNSVHTDGTSSGSGVGVNMGIIHPNLSNITISSSSGAYNQTTTYETRIVPVPPRATTQLVEWLSPFKLMASKGFIKDNGNVLFSFTPRSRYIEQGKKIKLKKGFIRTYEPNTSPLRYRTLITYSLTEGMEEIKEVETSDNYLKAMVADSYKGWKDYRAENLPYCQPFMADPENYVCWLRYKEGAKLEDWEKVGVWVVGLPVAVVASMWMLLPR